MIRSGARSPTVIHKFVLVDDKIVSQNLHGWMVLCYFSIWAGPMRGCHGLSTNVPGHTHTHTMNVPTEQKTNMLCKCTTEHCRYFGPTVELVRTRFCRIRPLALPGVMNEVGQYIRSGAFRWHRQEIRRFLARPTRRRLLV